MRELGAVEPFIVTGFYTPNYAALAEKFAANLDKFAAPHSLYPVPATAWENAILLKPQIVQRAMNAFPGTTVVLMDIDCRLKGPIDPIADCIGDVSLFVGVRYDARARKGARLRVVPSSRVMVCRPTPVTRRLLENWESLCGAQNPERPDKDDEHLLMEAIGMTEGLSLTIIDKRYSGRDPKDAPKDAVVLHHSAHLAIRIATEPRVYLKHLRRRIIGKIIGKPYERWKYGIEMGENDAVDGSRERT